MRIDVRRLLLIVVALSLVAPMIASRQPVTHATDPGVDERVAELMATLTLEQQVGQLFMVSFWGTRLLQTSRDFIYDYHPGAVALFGSNVDFQSPAETTALINTMQSLSIESSGVPLFVAIDQEGGRVWRLVNGFTQFPQPLYLTASGNSEVAFEVGQAMGAELSAVGVNMNLAPVVDLSTADDAIYKTRVLYQRTMGQDAKRVGEMAGALSQGMASSGVVGVAKHFPGHSPTGTDSHIDLPTVDLDAATFRQTNLEAFRQAVANHVPVVMMGHLYYPALEPDEVLPASLSPAMIDLLREDLGFEGVIMTDALDMGAIQRRYTAPEAAVMALNAGVDMIATGPNMPFRIMQATVERVQEAVRNGEISPARFREAVERVLRLKAEHDLLDWSPLDESSAESRIPVDQTSMVLSRAFEAGTTLVYDDYNLVPVQANESVAVIRPSGFQTVSDVCSQSINDTNHYIYAVNPSILDINAAAGLARNADKVVVVVSDIHLHANQASLVNILPPEKTIVVSLGTPYDWNAITNRPGAFIAGYSDHPEAQQAVCHLIGGQIEPRGRLSVALNGLSIGTGVVEAMP